MLHIFLWFLKSSFYVSKSRDDESIEYNLLRHVWITFSLINLFSWCNQTLHNLLYLPYLDCLFQHCLRLLSHKGFVYTSYAKNKANIESCLWFHHKFVHWLWKWTLRIAHILILMQINFDRIYHFKRGEFSEGARDLSWPLYCF